MKDRVRIIPGDCRESMRRMIAAGEAVDAIACDPPYHLQSIVDRFGADDAAPAKSDGATGVYGRAARGFMGQTWDGGDVAFDVETWRLCLQVLKPGGHLIAFGGTRSYHRMACAIEDAGFEIRDRWVDLVSHDDAVHRFCESLTDDQVDAFVRCLEASSFCGELLWVYGSGFPKSHKVRALVEKYQAKHGGDADPADFEGWGTALKPAHEPIVLARKPLEGGSVAANMLAHSVGGLNIDACQIPADDNTTKADRRPDGRTAKYRTGTAGATVPTERGRWPANVVHDGSAEVVEAFPDSRAGNDRKHRYSDKCRKVYKPFGGNEDTFQSYADDGSAARFFFSGKADKLDRWGSDHPTVKPVKLMRWLVRLVTPPGGTVLDPFAGTGTTGIACLCEGFRAILMEQGEDYLADIRSRLAQFEEDGPHSAGVRHRNTDKKTADDLPLFAAGEKP